MLLRPDEPLHGREIARRIGLPAGTVTRELNTLTAVGLLSRERRGNQQVYSANTQAVIYVELASILRKTSGLADAVILALAPLASRLRSAFVYGSIARGEPSAQSDVDLMLIGEIGFREAVELLYPLQTTLGREVNPHVLSVSEFVAGASSEPFLANVLANPKVFVIGTEVDLAELVGRKS